MKKKDAEYKIQIKHCQKCVNNCPLDDPRCITGITKAEEGDIYEIITEEKCIIVQKSLKKLRESIKK